MRFRLRTLLIAGALGPPVLAAAWWVARVVVAAGPEIVVAWLFATPILALLFAPFWIPLVYFAYLIRAGEFRIGPELILFIFVELCSIFVSGFLLENLPD